MNKLTEIKEKLPEYQHFEKTSDGQIRVLGNIYRLSSEKYHEDVTYLLSLLEEKDKALQDQHRYFERISVTFGEFECQRLAKEAMEKYTSSNNEGES